MRVLICAATYTEAVACRRGLNASHVASDFEVLITGVGPRKSAAALRRRLRRKNRPALVVSTGFAGQASVVAHEGAEQPRSLLGSWVCATQLFKHEGELRVVPVQMSALRTLSAAGVEQVSVLSVSKLLARPIVGVPGAVAVDMESAALADICEEANLPLLVLRYVTDSPDSPLPGFIHPVAAVLAADDLASRVRPAAEAVLGMLNDPAAVLRLVRESGRWRLELAKGWRRFAEDTLKLAEQRA